MSDIETIKLHRIGREIDAVHKDLKDLKNKHGPNSPQVLALLTEMAQRLSAQPGNEVFVDALRSRIERLQTAS